MAEFTKEQLINLARENVRVLKQAAMQHKVQPVIAMDLRLAEIALAALTAPTEPVYQCEFCHHDSAGEQQWHWEDVNKEFYEQYDPDRRGKRRVLYAAPQLPQPAVAITQHFDTIALDTAKMVMCDVNRRDEFLGGDIQLLSRIQCRIDEACCAAMLQGAEPVQSKTLRDGLEEIRSLGGIDAGKIQAERDALNEDGQGWIPCSERMPEIEGHYLVWANASNLDGYCDHQAMATYQGGEWSNEFNWLVTHWMPLPAAPQQEVK